MSDLKQIMQPPESIEQRPDWRLVKIIQPDAAGNLWRIDVQGAADAVNPFVDLRPYSLTIETIEAAEPELDPPLEKTGREEVLVPSDEMPKLPVLGVTFTLEQLAETIKPPYRVLFEIDPCMVDAYDDYTFCLQGSDSQANVSFEANGGTIRVWLAANRQYRAAEGVAGNAVATAIPQHCQCHLSVQRLTGAPCYTLRGDITVNSADANPQRHRRARHRHCELRAGLQIAGDCAQGRHRHP